jgi:hypothetical protein
MKDQFIAIAFAYFLLMLMALKCMHWGLEILIAKKLTKHLHKLLAIYFTMKV